MNLELEGAMDAEGCYDALHSGGKLHRYEPDRKLAYAVRLPVHQPTICHFAGENLGELYTTSGREELSPADLKKKPNVGGILRITPDASGQPQNWCVG